MSSDAHDRLRQIVTQAVPLTPTSSLAIGNVGAMPYSTEHPPLEHLLDFGEVHRGLSRSCFALHASASLATVGLQLAAVQEVIDHLATGSRVRITFGDGVPASLRPLHAVLRRYGCQMQVHCIFSLGNVRRVAPTLCLGSPAGPILLPALAVSLLENHCVLCAVCFKPSALRGRLHTLAVGGPPTSASIRRVSKGSGVCDIMQRDAIARVEAAPPLEELLAAGKPLKFPAGGLMASQSESASLQDYFASSCTALPVEHRADCARCLSWYLMDEYFWFMCAQRGADSAFEACCKARCAKLRKSVDDDMIANFAASVKRCVLPRLHLVHFCAPADAQTSLIFRGAVFADVPTLRAHVKEIPGITGQHVQSCTQSLHTALMYSTPRTQPTSLLMRTALEGGCFELSRRVGLLCIYDGYAPVRVRAPGSRGAFESEVWLRGTCHRVSALICHQDDAAQLLALPLPVSGIYLPAADVAFITRMMTDFPNEWFFCIVSCELPASSSAASISVPHAVDDSDLGLDIDSPAHKAERQEKIKATPAKRLRLAQAPNAGNDSKAHTASSTPRGSAAIAPAGALSRGDKSSLARKQRDAAPAPAVAGKVMVADAPPRGNAFHIYPRGDVQGNPPQGIFPGGSPGVSPGDSPGNHPGDFPGMKPPGDPPGITQGVLQGIPREIPPRDPHEHGGSHGRSPGGQTLGLAYALRALGLSRVHVFQGG